VLTTTPVPSTRPVLLLDFDGTVCLGDGPVLAYAEEAFAQLPAALRADADRRVAAYLAHTPQDGDDEAADAYSLVLQIAGSHIGADALSAAYLASRKRLETDDLGIHPPEGLHESLQELGPQVTRVLMTNSPELGLERALETLGVAGLLDQVVCSAAKPVALARHVGVLLGGQSPHRLLSVGDHWTNDIAVPRAMGCATAYLAPAPHPLRPADVTARTYAELALHIKTWARSA